MCRVRVHPEAKVFIGSHKVQFCIISTKELKGIFRSLFRFFLSNSMHYLSNRQEALECKAAGENDIYKQSILV